MNQTMIDTSQENKQLVEKLYRDCINTGNTAQLDRLIHEGFVGARGEKGPAGFTQTIATLRTGFPDVHFTLEDLVAENDRVVARWKMEGTHLGPFAGFPASQKRVTQTAIVIYQIKDSKIIRAWLQPDSLGLLQQIGAIPALNVRPPTA
jgi:steroid delta-isomerase-like uncharacterized protein